MLKLSTVPVCDNDRCKKPMIFLGVRAVHFRQEVYVMVDFGCKRCKTITATVSHSLNDCIDQAVEATDIEAQSLSDLYQGGTPALSTSTKGMTVN